MLNKIISLAMILFVALLPDLLADTLYLKDGKIVHGKVIKKTDRLVYVQCLDKALTIRCQDILRIEKDRSALHPGSQRKSPSLAAANQVSSEQWLAKGDRHRRNGHYRQAQDCYHCALKQSPHLADRIEWDLAGLAYDFNDYQESGRILQQILRRNPNHALAQVLLSKLQKQVMQNLSDEITAALALYQGRHYRSALAKFIQIANQHPQAQLQKASKICQEQTGASLEQIMIDSRFHLKCPHPDCHQGVIRCRHCNSTGRVRKYSRPIIADNTQVNSSVSQIYCPRCKGKGSFSCPKCNGTGLYFGKITEFERKKFVEVLVQKGLALGKNAKETFSEDKEKRQKDVQVWGVSCYNIIGMTRRGIFFLENAVNENPSLASIAGLALQDHIKSLKLLRSNVFMSVALGYMAASEYNYQQAVNISARDADTLTPPARTMKAQEALSLAESSRLFLLQALEEDKTAISPLRGDMERLLAQVEQHIVRCHKTYAMLRKLEAGQLTPKQKKDIQMFMERQQEQDK